MLHKNGAFFSRSELIREANCHFLTNELGDQQCTIFLLHEIGKYFCQMTINHFLVQEKGKNFRNAYLANTHKCNCHDMNWNDIDI